MASIVIKVKYEETLRRFSVAINGDQRLDLSIEGLRLKIQSLFNLPLDAKFRLAYKDEDDDLVTLVDDDDLHDVVKQGLNPVRITVHLNSDQNVQSCPTLSSGSAALGTPSPHNVHPKILPNFAKGSKSMQEPLTFVPPSRYRQLRTDPSAVKTVTPVQVPSVHTSSKLSSDISSKAGFTSPVLGDLFNGLTKMSQSYVNAAHPCSGATSVSRHIEVGNDSKAFYDGRKHEGIRTDGTQRIIEVTGSGKKKKDVPSRTKHASSKEVEEGKTWDELEKEVISCESRLQKDDFKKVSNRGAVDRNWGFGSQGECPFGGIPPGFELSSDQFHKKARSFNRTFNKSDRLGSIIHKGITCDGCEVHPIVGPRFKSKVRYDYDLCSNCFNVMGNDIDYTRIELPLAHKHLWSSKAPNVAASSGSVFHTGITCDGCETVPIAGPRFKSKVKYDYDLCSTCFSQMGNDADYTRIDFPLARKHPRTIRVPDMAASLGLISHKDVGCNSCGAFPITGPRFQSKVKYDYDLCSICFLRMGNDTDYTKIDFPLAHKHPWSSKTPDVSSCPYIRPRILKQLGARLDSHFIMDVNVMDGTTMAPSTPFTKIWRMRNNGTIPWVRGLQLLWIGGDRFRPSDSIEIQVPSAGVNVGLELNIAVDFIAPELPGRYISYWRMAEPSGHKFGQRVWVQIEVDPSLDLSRESSVLPNLNHSPDSNETEFSHVVDVKVETGFEVEVSESRPPFIADQNHKIQMTSLNFPINDDLLVASDVVNPSFISALSSVPPAAASEDRPGSPVTLSPNSYPEVDADSSHIPETFSAPLASHLSGEEFGESFATRSNVLDITLNENNIGEANEKTEFKEKLLMELEELGFKRIDLNKEVLLTNETGRSEDDDDDDLRSNVQEDNIIVDENNNLEVNEKTEFKDKLLVELGELGFKRIDLNKEFLRPNETRQSEDDIPSNVQGDNITLGENSNIEQVNDKAEFKNITELLGTWEIDWDCNEAHLTNKTEQSEDDLSDDSEWDPILEELKEMGFEDKDTNKKLLTKNNGSISRVVMDLIAEEKA